MSSHELRVGSHVATQLPISTANKIVDVAGGTKPVQEIQPIKSKRSLLSSSPVRVTRARSKKKCKELAMSQIVVDLDPSEEVKIIMEQQELYETPTQDMDTGKEPKGELNPMSTLTIINSLSTQSIPPSKEPSSTP